MKNAFSVRNGILAGVGTIAYFLLFYFVDKKLMLSPVVNWGSVVIFVIFMVRACRGESRSSEVYGFREALRTAFLVYVVGDLIYYLFYYVLHGLIDPQLVVLQREIMLETSRQLSEWLGVGGLERDIQRLGEEDLKIRPGGLLLSLSWSLIGGFIISLIIAAVTKK